MCKSSSRHVNQQHGNIYVCLCVRHVLTVVSDNLNDDIPPLLCELNEKLSKGGAISIDLAPEKDEP